MMIKITFNAFSFVREKLKKQDIPYYNAPMVFPQNTTPKEIMQKFELTDIDVEFVFINGKVHPKETPLQDGDRIAFVPPGTPGSYRLILGAKQIKKD